MKTRKPTGDADCPPEVHCARDIDHMLQSKIAARDLDDGEIIDIDYDNDDDDDGGYSDDEMSEDDNGAGPVPRCRPIPRVRTARVEAQLPSQDSIRQPSSKGADVLEKISRTFDPEVQSRREADHASSMFQSQQLLLLQSQVRDLNATVLSLRNQLDDAERRRIDADRHADRLQNQIDINTAITWARLYRSATNVPRHTTPILILSSPGSSPSTPDHHRRWEARFHGGGRCSWFGNGGQFDGDDDVVEVTRLPWSPPARSPAQSPPPSDTE